MTNNSSVEFLGFDGTKGPADALYECADILAFLYQGAMVRESESREAGDIGSASAAHGEAIILCKLIADIKAIARFAPAFIQRDKLNGPANANAALN